MKKSCFLRSVFILTILTGVIVYLVQTKWDTIKNMLVNVLVNFNQLNNNMFDPLVKSLKESGPDSLIDREKLNQIKQILKKIEDEGSKKDRN